MSKTHEKFLLLFTDFAVINLASILFLWMKFVGGQLENVERSWQRLHPHSEGSVSFWFTLDYYFYPLLALYLCWLLLFLFFGSYRSRAPQSRFDEVLELFKVVTLGVLLLFVATLDLTQSFRLTRALMFSYWFALFATIAMARVAVRSFERQLLLRGIGRRNTVIVGTHARGERLLHDLGNSPGQGFNVIGFVPISAQEPRFVQEEIPVLGPISELSAIINAHAIDSVLIALQSNSHEEILDIVDASGGQPVSFSITPDLYDIVTGHVRTNQIHGVPLMELRPELMPAWEQTMKRTIDSSVAILIGLGLAPLWILVALAILVDSKGPVLFRQDRIGKDGRRFTIYKFRSMLVDAEQSTGPVWVKGEDPRITRMGRILRALHIDEVPQCINFLRGDMSLVGPRPERPYFVELFSREIPFYMRRFNVKPGLLGWAQSKHEFDINSSDVVTIAKERLEYDLYYIENISLKLDLKIMLRTIWFVLAGKSTR
jgi:exopolysaccharide biosynthesis polyprenyl glycosylphosphotransferase